MSQLLTGKTVSSTYLDLVQHASDNNYYDGAGNLLSITDGSTLQVTLVNYINDSSLSSDFYWNNSNELEVSTGFGGVTLIYVDGSLAVRDAEIDSIDASVVRIDLYNIIQDTSHLADVNRIDASISKLTPTLVLLTNDYLLTSPSTNQYEYIIKNISTGDVSVYTDGTYQIDTVNQWILSSMNTMNLISYDVSNWYII